MPREPLLLREHEAAWPDGDKVLRKDAAEEPGIAPPFGGGPILPELLETFASIFHRISSDAYQRGVYGCAGMPGSEDRCQFRVTDVI